MKRHVLWIGWELYCSCREERKETSKIDGLLEPEVDENKHVVELKCLDCKTKFSITQQTEIPHV